MDEDIIQDQIADAKEIIAREEAEMEARYAVDETNESAREQTDGPLDKRGQLNHEPPSDPDAQAPAEPTRKTSETIGPESRHGKSPDISTANAASSSNVKDQPVAAVDHAEERGAEDDGGEVMEDNEDTVIY